MGRRKIEIQPLSDDRNRTVTFVKRKAGLFKKAHELAVLCQVDLAVIIVGNNKKVYEFSSVDTNELIDCYQNSSPYELKLPENYGNYQKKSHLQEGFSSNTINDDIRNVPVDDADSDYDSESPEPRPKRVKKEASPSSIYSINKPSVNSRYSQSSTTSYPDPHNDQGALGQRPVLRLQIPSDSKNSNTKDSAQTITAIDTTTEKKKSPHTGDSRSQYIQGDDAPTLADGSQYGGFPGKFKSPESRKQAPHLPIPSSKLQTLSPSSATVPQLPRNAGGMPFFSTLPNPSPPAILPTPVFNQAFNQQYLGQLNGGSAPGNHAQTLGSQTNGNSSHGNNNQQPGESDDNQKFKPQLLLHFNGEQTPVSGLPSRFVNDIFPSPTNLYPPQDWPTTMTSMTPNMPHYFVGMVPSSNGATPLGANPMYAPGRGPSLVPNEATSAGQSGSGPTQSHEPNRLRLFRPAQLNSSDLQMGNSLSDSMPQRHNQR